MALNRREKLLLGGLALVAMGLGTYNFVHEPLTTRRAEAREKLDQVQSQLLQEQRKLAKEGDLAERKSKVAAREQVLDSWVPGKNSAAMLIWHLSQAEQLSGARIRSLKAGEKKVVSVSGKEEEASQDSKAQTAQNPKAQTAQNSKALTTQNAKTQTAPNDAMATLVVIPLELGLEAKFAEHLIFNQYMEEAPLFLATNGIALSRKETPDMAKVSELIRGGNPWLAEQLLGESPQVDGVYRVNLYFKADKPGPSTDEMQFSAPPGRVDPFVMAAVDEFIQWLQEYFNNPRPGEPPVPLPPPQLG